MILYHGTYKKHLVSILKKGLFPSKIGIVYLSPTKEVIDFFEGDFDVLLEVETGDLKLTAFEDCEEWEVLCWGHIPPKNIKVLISNKDIGA